MGDIGKALSDLLSVMFWTVTISVPLGIWKAIEIIVWIWNHVSWTVS
jgi:hypothetical protein